MTTPQPSNQLPEEVKPPYKISEENQPSQGDWLYHGAMKSWTHQARQGEHAYLKRGYTHFHPDQPTAPTVTPYLAPRPPAPQGWDECGPVKQAELEAAKTTVKGPIVLVPAPVAEWAKRAGYEIGFIYSGSNLIAGANADHFAAIITKHAPADSASAQLAAMREERDEYKASRDFEAENLKAALQERDQLVMERDQARQDLEEKCAENDRERAAHLQAYQAAAKERDELRALLQDVSDYRQGRGRFNFAGLSDEQRGNAAHDAWESIYVRIRAALDSARAKQGEGQPEDAKEGERK